MNGAQSMDHSGGQNNLLYKVLVWELTAIFFFVPAGRFHFDWTGLSFSTGYDAYKLFPYIFLTWLIWRIRLPKPSWQFSRLTIPLTAFFAISICSSAASFNPYESLAESLEIGVYLVFTIMLFDLPWNRYALTRIGGGFVLGNLYMTGVGIGQWFAQRGLDGTFRMNATYDYPNALGVLAVLSFSLLAWLWSLCQIRWQRFFIGLAMFCVLFCGLATQSRATYLAFFVWLIVAIVFGGSRVKTWGLWLIMAILILAFPLVLHRFQGMLVEVGTKDEMSRIMIWPFLLDTNLPSLSFFGMGLGPVIPDQVAGAIASSAQDYALSRHWHPHNLFLYLFLATGALGLASFVWMLARSFQELWKMRGQGSLFLYCGLIAFLVHQLFEVHLLLANIPIAFFTLLVIGSVVFRQQQSIHSEQT